MGRSLSKRSGELPLGVYINYKFAAECSEEDLLGKLNRLRTKLLALPLESVGPITKVDPVYNSLVLDQVTEDGLPMPPVISEHLAMVDDDGRQGLYRVMMAQILLLRLPKDMFARFIQPVLDFVKETDLWDAADYPEEMKIGPQMTINRMALLAEFTNVLLLYGYSISVIPEPGCEWVFINFVTYRNLDPPLWVGRGFTKTQYSNDFKKGHAAVCQILDLAKEEGLVLEVHDHCEYYERIFSISGGKGMIPLYYRREFYATTIFT